MDIVAGAIAGGVMGGIVAVILTLGLLRRDRRVRRSGVEHHPQTAAATPWRFASGPLIRRFTRYSPARPSPAAGSAPVPPPTRGPFDRFDDTAKRVLGLAQDEAIRLNHNYIGTEHLLAGLVREGQGASAEVLRELGADLAKVRNALEFIIGHGDRPTTAAEITLSPRTKKVIELAIDEARILGDPLVRGDHLLLGLLREGEGIASGILESLGISLEKTRLRIYELLAKSPPPSPRTQARGLLRHFSDRSKRAIAFAQNEATMMNHDHIGTEHLVLALARTSEGGKELLTEVFTELGLNLAQLREAVGKASPRREPGTPPSEIALAPDTRRSIELADEEATKRDCAVEPVHLLLGVALEGAGLGASVLAQLGATADRIREVMDRQR